MYLIPFQTLFPEIAITETLTLVLEDLPGVPTGNYILLESYCPDPDCNCQRVMLKIMSILEMRQVAAIRYSFKRSAKDTEPYLDPLNSQSSYAPAIRNALAQYLETDRAYVQRLKTHYAMVKAVAANPNHPVQKELAAWKGAAQSVRETGELPFTFRKARDRLDVIKDEPTEIATESKTESAANKRHRHRSAGRTRESEEK